jgi:hypothetical protein
MALRDSKKGLIRSLGEGHVKGPRDSKNGLIGSLGIPRVSNKGLLGLQIPKRD